MQNRSSVEGEGASESGEGLSSGSILVDVVTGTIVKGKIGECDLVLGIRHPILLSWLLARTDKKNTLKYYL